MADQSERRGFTPGPWSIERTTISAYIRPVQCGHYIAHIDVPHDDWHKPNGSTRADANACLIAAAPDLYEACHEAIGECVDDEGRCGFCGSDDKRVRLNDPAIGGHEEWCAIHKLRAALRKAEGREGGEHE